MRTKEYSPKYYLCSMTTRAARRMVAYYNRELEPFEITANQVMALGVLWREENITLGEFARRAGVGKAAAATMIDRLEAVGYVTRAEHPDDGRLNLLRLTPKAMALAPKVAEAVDRLEQAVEEALGEDGMKNLLRYLKTIEDLNI